MRITNTMLQNTVVTNLNARLTKLEKLQEQLTTSKRLNHPSDDPADVGQALNLRSALAAIDQYMRNMDSANNWLNASEASLSATTELLQRARELAVQGANDSLDAQQRTSIATEVQQLLEQAVGQGNSTLAGKRLFAGFKIDANPFALAGSSVTYSGDGGQMLREIDAGTTSQTNVAGPSTFNPVFNGLISLRDHLLSNDGASIGTTDLAAIDSAMSNLLNVRADVGARTNRLDSALTRQESLKARLTGLLSKTEDTDFAEAITDFTNQQNVYQAALAAGAKALQPSLLDYLR